MQIVWLGQGGLMMVSQKHKLLIDPYLTNTLKKLDKRMKRRVGIKKKYFKLKPDIILLTNSHPANTDEKTLVRFIKQRRKKKDRLTVLSCESSFGSIFSNKEYKRANHIMFGEGDEWTIENMHIKAVKARTNDRSAFGVLVTDLSDCKKYYIAANTLYNEEIINSLPSDIFAAFIPISGTYGCMNRLDAQRFATRLEATYVVPINYGMFDKIDPEEFVCVGRVIPKPFKVISFNITPVSTTTQNVFDRRFNEKLTPEQAEALSKSKKKKKGTKKQPEYDENLTQGGENELLDIPAEEEPVILALPEGVSENSADDIKSISYKQEDMISEGATASEADSDNVPDEDDELDELDLMYSEKDFEIVPLVSEEDEVRQDKEYEKPTPPKLKNPNGKRKKNTVILGSDNPTVLTTEE